MKTTVIHHSADFDGLFCREIARKFLPDAELIGWDYADSKIPFPREGTVYILDLSPDCFEFLPISNPFPDPLDRQPELKRVIWIDHHKSAIEKWPDAIKGYRIDGVAACRLVWQWFAGEPPNFDNRGGEQRTMPTKEDFIDRKVSEPLAVRLAGEYDIWDKRDDRSELFQHGLRSRKLTDETWKRLLDPNDESLEVESLLMAGRALQYAKTEENASIINAIGFDLEFEGMCFLACNHARYNSFLFTAGLKEQHDACFGFKWDGKQWQISLYHAPGHEHHDLSLIATKYGGGGHRGACGFRIDKLPFLT